MNESKYPDYIELLKLKKELSIYEIAALTLGIDPRCLKLKPNYDEKRKCYTYDEAGPAPVWYLPVIAEKLSLKDYLISESDSMHLLPLNQINQDLGPYIPGYKDALYQELKSLLIEAVKERDILGIKPLNIDEDLFFNHLLEGTKVNTESVKDWFKNHNFHTPFFDAPSKPEGLPNYLDKNHANHSQELAIAIEAWQRFADLDITHPKLYIEKWLEIKYPDSSKSSNDTVATYVSTKAKNRIATVANWNPVGGTKTTAFKQSTFQIAIDRKI